MVATTKHDEVSSWFGGCATKCQRLLKSSWNRNRKYSYKLGVEVLVHRGGGALNDRTADADLGNKIRLS